MATWMKVNISKARSPPPNKGSQNVSLSSSEFDDCNKVTTTRAESSRLWSLKSPALLWRVVCTLSCRAGQMLQPYTQTKLHQSHLISKKVDGQQYNLDLIGGAADGSASTNNTEFRMSCHTPGGHDCGEGDYGGAAIMPSCMSPESRPLPGPRS